MTYVVPNTWTSAHKREASVIVFGVKVANFKQGFRCPELSANQLEALREIERREKLRTDNMRRAYKPFQSVTTNPTLEYLNRRVIDLKTELKLLHDELASAQAELAAVQKGLEALLQLEELVDEESAPRPASSGPSEG